MTSLRDHTYIGIFGGQPVAMFVLFEKEMSPESRARFMAGELMYVYVDKHCRDLGFGRQVVNEAKRIARAAGSDTIVLDTLKTRLNPFYERCGAKVIAEGRLFTEPTDILMMRV
jgi:GNAT superfamily N-acetyltransferase